jgi:hypothetical protein
LLDRQVEAGTLDEDRQENKLFAEDGNSGGR